MDYFSEYEARRDKEINEYTPENYVKMRELNRKLKEDIEKYSKRGVRIVSAISAASFIAFTAIILTVDDIFHYEDENAFFLFLLSIIVFFSWAISCLFSMDGLRITKAGKEVDDEYRRTEGYDFKDIWTSNALNNYGRRELNINKFTSFQKFGNFYKCKYTVNGIEKEIILNFNEETGVVTPANS